MKISALILLLSFYGFATLPMNQWHSISATIDATINTIQIDQRIDWINTSTTPTQTIFIHVDNSRMEKNPHVSDILNDSGFIGSFTPSIHTISSVKANGQPLPFKAIDDQHLARSIDYSSGHNLWKLTLYV